MRYSQGVTLVTLTPTRFARFKQFLLLRWVLRYPSFTSATRRFLGRSQRGAGPGVVLEALNFIHFGRWILMQKRPIRGWRVPGLPQFDWQPDERPDHGFMVFTSNFDDEWPAYVDTFMEATLDDLGVFWDQTPGWVPPVDLGFEGFFTFVDKHTIDHAHYYAAFPRLATTDIKAALAVDRHVRSFAIHTKHMNNAAWDSAFDLLVSALQQNLGTINWKPPMTSHPMAFVPGGGDHLSLTSLSPFPAEMANELESQIATLMHERTSPFAAVAGTHFARIAVVSKVHDGDEKRALQSAYILMSVDADGSLGKGDAWVGELFDVWSNIHPTGASGTLIDLVWGSCYGFGPNRTKQQFLDYIAATSFKPTVPFADYPRTSLWDIHRALHTHEWFTEFVFARADGGGQGKRDFRALLATSPSVESP